MKRYWQLLAANIDARPMLHRALIFAVTLLVLVLLLDSALLSPVRVKQKALAQQAAERQAKLSETQAQVQTLLAAQKNDPNIQNRARLEQLVKQLAKVNEQLQEMQKGLVQPDRMAAALEDILRQNKGLQLVSLKTLPVRNLKDADVDAPVQPQPAQTGASSDAQRKGQGETALFKHGVELTVQGSYPDMLHYLAQLEKLPWNMFWRRAELKVETYPVATLKLTLYTVSLDRAWLSL
jgi:MSHA biogenesis protein MshJ